MNGKHPERTWTQTMHFCLSAHADCSSNLYLLWWLESFMPLLGRMPHDCGLSGRRHLVFSSCANVARLCQRSTNTASVLNWNAWYFKLNPQRKEKVEKLNQLWKRIFQLLHKYFLVTLVAWLQGRKYLSVWWLVSAFTSLLQTEISQQLINGLSWNHFV